MSARVQPLEETKLTKADFVSDQNVRWCPGCGDYSILANVQKVMPEIGIPREKIVFISGIGCSSRFPYYMNTYGFHTIHGRAPAVATGLKVTRPDLSVWVVTGDGDGLSIGGNHLIHVLRRNIDLNILLFNNRIYGLTKGQYSPTSELGKHTKSTPWGAADSPLEPIRLALAAGASFVARSLDVDPKGLQSVLKAAPAHKGTAFVEIYQNCNIFNDNAFLYISERGVREERMLFLEHGQPLVFGKNKDKGICLKQMRPHVVALGNGMREEDLIVHDVANPMMAELLSQLQHPEFPVPMGILYQQERDTYEDLLAAKIQQQTAQKGRGDLKKLLHTGQVWEISSTPTVQSLEPAEELDLQDIDILPEAPKESKMEHPIRSLNPPEPLVVAPTDSVAHAIEQMQQKNYGCVHVQEEEKLLGIFTDGDIVNKVIGYDLDLNHTPVSELMTAQPVCAELKDTIAYAFNQMVIAGSHHLPLLDNGKPVGFTSARGLLAYIGGYL